MQENSLLKIGSMHSGYPIGVHLKDLPTLLNLKTRKKGRVVVWWGIFHELGHNHQWRQYSSKAVGEVGCNFWTLVLHEVLHHSLLL